MAPEASPLARPLARAPERASASPPCSPSGRPSAMAVLGLEISDPRLQALTRRILAVAVLSALLVVATSFVTFIWRPSRGQDVAPDGSGLVGLALALLVPACGYYGARNSDQRLMCCFCGCSLIGGIVQSGRVAMIATWLTFWHRVVAGCDPSQGQVPAWCPTSNCGEGTTAQACYDDSSGSIRRSSRILIVVMVALHMPSIVFQCLGFMWGNRLLRKLRVGAVFCARPEAPATDARHSQSSGTTELGAWPSAKILSTRESIHKGG